MGAFCVFGVSRSGCRKLAEKSVPTFDKWTRRELTAPEWGELVKAEGDRLFGETMKEGRISPELDTPPVLPRLDCSPAGRGEADAPDVPRAEDRQARSRGGPQGRAGADLASVRRDGRLAASIRRGLHHPGSRA